MKLQKGKDRINEPHPIEVLVAQVNPVFCFTGLDCGPEF